MKDKLHCDILELEQLLLVSEYEGELIRVISGGNGCLIANGIIGKIIAKPEKRPERYSGNCFDNSIGVYVKDTDGTVYGMCEGFELTRASKNELSEQFLKN